VEPIIDLAPGAEDNALAVHYATTLRDNLQRHRHRVALFRALRGSVQLVPFDTGDALTLRFDLGRLTIHDGSIGIPSVTIGGPSAALEKLDEVPMSRWLRVPFPTDRSGRKTLADFARSLARGEIKIYGLWSHPRMVARLLSILSTR
jgi:hypothetical protein